MSDEADLILYLAAHVALGGGPALRAVADVLEGDFVAAAAERHGVSRWRIRDILRTLSGYNPPSPALLRNLVDALEAALPVQPDGCTCPFCGKQGKTRNLILHIIFVHRRQILEAAGIQFK